MVEGRVVRWGGGGRGEYGGGGGRDHIGKQLDTTPAKLGCKLQLDYFYRWSFAHVPNHHVCVIQRRGDDIIQITEWSSATHRHRFPLVPGWEMFTSNRTSWLPCGRSIDQEDATGSASSSVTIPESRVNLDALSSKIASNKLART